MYPDIFQVSKGPISDDVSDYYSLPLAVSSAMNTPFEDDAFSESRHFTFQILLGSAANQLQLLRFELRVLRFFNDICLPHFTYNVNKRQASVWENVVPQYFNDCLLIKLAILATGCLSLMPTMGFQRVIRDGMTEDEVLMELEQVCDQFDVQQLFADENLLEGGEVNLFRKASELLAESMNDIQQAMLKLQSPELTQVEKLPYIIGATIGNSLLFGFLGLHPWKLVPLVHFPEDGERKADLLDVASGLKSIVLANIGPLQASDIGELYHNDELALSPRTKIKIVEDIKKQLNEYLLDFSFFEIDLERSNMINTYRDCVKTLEKVCGLAFKFNYPVMLFRWLFLINHDYVKYVRSQEPFALRLLYIYLCICVHYRFWLFEYSIWRDYVVYYRARFGPLREFDERLYHFVVTRKRYVLGDNYRSIKDLDVWSEQFDY